MPFDPRMTPPERARALLELMRPPNLVTAAADVLAGAAVADALLDPRLLALVLASALLYAGSAVMNDVFDARLDARERPERPIPSGRVTRSEGFSFGSLLLLVARCSPPRCIPRAARLRRPSAPRRSSTTAWPRRIPWRDPSPWVCAGPSICCSA